MVNSTTEGGFRRILSPLDGNGYPVAPAELQLEQVHVFVRHGERTPVGVRMAKYIPEHWMLCKAARNFRASVVGSFELQHLSNTDFLAVRKIVERADGTSAEGQCLLGELTDVGRESTYKFGSALRSIYVDKLGFLPDSIHHESQVYFRSTNMPRTIESLQEIIHGLYPTKPSGEGITPVLHVRNGQDENLLGNTYACDRLQILQAGFAKAAASAYNRTLEPLDKKISKYIDGQPVRLDGKPRASGILDTVRAATAHGIKVPSEFEEKGVLDLIEKAVVNEWFSGYKTEEVRRLGMGPLLSTMLQKMQQKVRKGDDDPLKILVHSTHDTALAALCSTLDVFDDKWPAFTASITFELFKHRKTTVDGKPDKQGFLGGLTSHKDNDYYVRMRYQNKNMLLPICADDDKHLPGAPEFCTLKAFKERVDELTPKDWKNECSKAI